MLISELKHECGAIREFYSGGQETLYVPHGIRECSECLKWSSKQSQKFMKKIRNKKGVMVAQFVLIIISSLSLFAFGILFLNPNKKIVIVLVIMLIFCCASTISIFYLILQFKKPEIMVAPVMTRESRG